MQTAERGENKRCNFDLLLQLVLYSINAKLIFAFTIYGYWCTYVFSFHQSDFQSITGHSSPLLLPDESGKNYSIPVTVGSAQILLVMLSY